LRSPIAIFDAGIGSYAIVRAIHQRYPKQDVLYFADRRSFPYGDKTRKQLLEIMRASVELLKTLGAHAIVMASNAPSILVLDELSADDAVPLFGVFPPIREALLCSKTKQVAVLGVQSLVESPQLRDYVERQCQGGGQVFAFNASALVQLVETGAFVSEVDSTSAQVSAFVASILERNPSIDVMTLSSTHLPWLASYFRRLYPQLSFLDPAQAVVERLGPHVTEGEGRIVCLATESDRFTFSDFQVLLRRLGVDAPVVLLPS
jgi:glutamate racemase